MQHSVLKVLKSAAQLYTGRGVETQQEWITHAGRSTSHHMGPAAVLRRLGVVRKCHTKHTGALRLNKKGQARRVASTALESMQAKAQVLKYICFADSLGSLPATRTCKQWGAAVCHIMRAIEESTLLGSL